VFVEAVNRSNRIKCHLNYPKSASASLEGFTKEGRSGSSDWAPEQLAQICESDE